MQETKENNDKNIEEIGPQKPKDRFFNFLVSQIVICAIAVVFVLTLKFIGGEYYNYTREFFDNNFNKPINVQQVLDAKQTQEVLLAQSTVYGAGGTEEQVRYLKNKSEISDEETEEIESSGINSMCIPVNGKITSEYSYRVHPISGNYLFHSGLDIGADSGEDIKCALDGEVSEVDNEETTSYGKYIVVSHSDNTSTLYAHCSKILASEGDKVKKGEIIAKVGSTGNSTGPHLHFEIRVNGVRLNPEWFADFV